MRRVGLQILLLTVLAACVGCSAPARPEFEGVRRAAPAKPAGSLSVRGALILRQEGRTFVCRKKCEACGALGAEQISPDFHSVSWTLKSEFLCPKCGKRQTVLIERRQ